MRYRSHLEKRTKELVGAEALVQAALKKLGYSTDVYAAFEVWDRLLGTQATKARAIAVKGHRLCVEVDSHARLHDLTLRKRDLLRKINQHFGERRVISDIIFEAPGKRHEPKPHKAR